MKIFTHNEVKGVKAGTTLWVIFSKTTFNLGRSQQLYVYPVYCTGRPQNGYFGIYVPVNRDLLDSDKCGSHIYSSISSFFVKDSKKTYMLLPTTEQPARTIAGVYKTYRQAVKAAVLMTEEDMWKGNRCRLPHDLSDFVPRRLVHPRLTGIEYSKYTTGKSRMQRDEEMLGFMRSLRHNFDIVQIGTKYVSQKVSPLDVGGESFLDQIADQPFLLTGMQTGKSNLSEYMAREAEKRGVKVIRHKQRDSLIAMAEPNYFEFGPPQWALDLLEAPDTKEEPVLLDDVKAKSESVRDRSTQYDPAGYVRHFDKELHRPISEQLADLNLPPEALLTEKKPFSMKIFPADQESESKDDESKV